MEHIKFEESNINTYYKRVPINKEEFFQLRALFRIVPEIYFVDKSSESISSNLQLFNDIKNNLPKKSFIEYLDNNYFANAKISDNFSMFAMFYINEEEREEYNNCKTDRMPYLIQETNNIYVNWANLFKKAKKKCKLVIKYLESLDTNKSEFTFKHFTKQDKTFNFIGSLVELASLLTELKINISSKELSELCFSKISTINSKKLNQKSLDTSIRKVKSNYYYSKNEDYNEKLSELRQIIQS